MGAPGHKLGGQGGGPFWKSSVTSFSPSATGSDFSAYAASSGAAGAEMQQSIQYLGVEHMVAVGCTRPPDPKVWLPVCQLPAKTHRSASCHLLCETLPRPFPPFCDKAGMVLILLTTIDL